MTALLDIHYAFLSSSGGLSLFRIMPPHLHPFRLRCRCVNRTHKPCIRELQCGLLLKLYGYLHGIVIR